MGELAPEEMDVLETRLLTESGLFDLAESVEDDVVDRYVRGEMSAEEERRFERRLLPSRRIQERVAFARALAFRKAAHTAKRAERPAWLAPIIPLFRSPARLAWAATLVAALAAGVLAHEVMQLRGDRHELERSYAATLARLEEARQAEAPPKSPDPEAAAVDAARLARELTAMRERVEELEARELVREAAPTPPRRDREEDLVTATAFLALATRSNDDPDVLRLEGADRALLELEVLASGQMDPLAATVTRDGTAVWHTTEVEVKSSGTETVAELVLPRESLTRGRYEIRLTGGTDATLLGLYEVLIEE